MTLDKTHLEYPRRGYGMDHDRYAWSQLSERTPIQWPGGKKLALWINVCVQFFPLNQQGKPFPVPGGMTMPYPDLRHFSLRDYGNRVGIVRILQALDRYGLKASFAINGEMAQRYPALVRRLCARGDEIIAHGWNMDSLHHDGLDETAEADLIERTLSALSAYAQTPVKGWLSPARNQSSRTPDMLKAAGIDYMCDWVNDDLPYPFNSRAGELLALPLSTELEDTFILHNNLHPSESYTEQLLDAAAFLTQEAEQQGGRLLALNIHPWMLGQPHRIAYLERVLENLAGQAQIWNARPGEILNCWRAQQHNTRT